MYMIVPLHSAAEIERLHTAAYRFAETRRDGKLPTIITEVSLPQPAARVFVDDDDAARDFSAFWSGFRARRLDMAA